MIVAEQLAAVCFYKVLIRKNQQLISSKLTLEIRNVACLFPFFLVSMR